jgi:hypothetical protein
MSFKFTGQIQNSAKIASEEDNALKNMKQESENAKKQESIKEEKDKSDISLIKSKDILVAESKDILVAESKDILVAESKDVLNSSNNIRLDWILYILILVSLVISGYFAWKYKDTLLNFVKQNSLSKSS